MKVLHLVKTSYGAKWALLQASELVKLGVEVHVALPPFGRRIEQYKAAGIQVHLADLAFPLHAPWRIQKTLSTCRELVAHINPDLIHSHFVNTTFSMRLALGKKHPIPRIFQVPGPLHLEHTLSRQLELGTAGPNDYWIGSCRWTCNRYQQSGISQDRIFLSYYGIDLQAFNGEHPLGRLRQEMKVDVNTPLVGMIAYMYAPKYYLGQTRGLKGHEDLIDALVICRKQLPHIKGVFIGGALGDAISYEQHVRQYARRKLGDGAIFLGTRNDVAILYPDFNVMVHPSHSENVGGAVESLLMGVPTIATHVGGFPDVVIPGSTGWLVPPHNPERLAEAILDVLNDPQTAKKRAMTGQELVRQLMEVKKKAAEILEIYHTILQQCSGTCSRLASHF